MNIVEMRQTEPIIQEQTKIPQSQRRTGARAARRDERELRWGLTEQVVSGQRGALDASITSARLHHADRSISTSVSESRRAH